MLDSPPSQDLRIAWLGQAGFALRYGEVKILIDPYLSNYLAKKYHGQEFAHERMMPTPLEPNEITDLDFVFCTHAHSDHMDPETLPVLAENNPDCLFVFPTAERDTAQQRGVPEGQIITIDADEQRDLGDSIMVNAIRAAHEQFAYDEANHHRFLGYVLRFGEIVLYHSGDTIVYDELAQRLKKFSPDLALLPVNGRDKYRSDRGVPGNMSFDEALALCRDTGIPSLVPHHFGMFSFNTFDTKEMKKRIASSDDPPKCLIPSTDHHFVLYK